MTTTCWIQRTQLSLAFGPPDAKRLLNWMPAALVERFYSATGEIAVNPLRLSEGHVQCTGMRAVVK